MKWDKVERDRLLEGPLMVLPPDIPRSLFPKLERLYWVKHLSGYEEVNASRELPPVDWEGLTALESDSQEISELCSLAWPRLR